MRTLKFSNADLITIKYALNRHYENCIDMDCVDEANESKEVVDKIEGWEQENENTNV